MSKTTTAHLTLQINGAERRVPAPSTAKGLLDHLELDPRTVVVEVNGQIVRRPRLPEVRLQDGDSIEIVHFVGGG